MMMMMVMMVDLYSALRKAPLLLNRLPASVGGKGGILTSAGWQVTVFFVCDPYGTRVSGSGEAKLLLTAIHCYFALLFTSVYAQWHSQDQRPCSGPL